MYATEAVRMFLQRDGNVRNPEAVLARAEATGGSKGLFERYKISDIFGDSRAMERFVDVVRTPDYIAITLQVLYPEPAAA